MATTPDVNMANNSLLPSQNEDEIRAVNLKIIWANLCSQFTPLNNILNIQGTIFESLNPEEVDVLLAQYHSTVNREGMLVRDAAVDRVFLGPKFFMEAQNLLYVAGQIPIFMACAAAAPSPTNTSASSPNSKAEGGKLTSTKSKPAKIPRPPNAFIIYRKTHHVKTVAQNPGLHNNKISVIIGEMWNSESEAVRADFKTQAEKLKQEHLRVYPDYTYKPRKPSEKKKRMSKKKAAALADEAAAAANRAKSVQIVNQYAALPQASDQLIKKVEDGLQLALPLPAEMSTNTLDHLLSVNFDEEYDGFVGYNFGPSASYQAAQAADMAFFPEIDQNQPAFKALLQEVGEAFEAGYYDSDLFYPAN